MCVDDEQETTRKAVAMVYLHLVQSNKKLRDFQTPCCAYHIDRLRLDLQFLSHPRQSVLQCSQTYHVSLLYL